MSSANTYHVIWWTCDRGVELMTGPYDSYDHVMGWVFDYRIRYQKGSDFRPVWIGDLSGLSQDTVKAIVSHNAKDAVTNRIPWGEKFSVEAS